METINDLNRRLAEKKFPTLTPAQKHLLYVMRTITAGGGVDHVRSLTHNMDLAGYGVTVAWVDEQTKLLDQLGLLRRKQFCRVNGSEYKTTPDNPFLIVTAIGRVVMEMIANERK